MVRNKILVLGAGGFIGTNLCRRLLLDGKNVVAFDRPGPGIEALIEFAKKEECTNFEYIYGDFHDFSNIVLADEYLKDIDCVYHLISTTCPTNSNLDIAEEMESNVIDSIRLFDACVNSKVGRVIFLSSGGTVYGKEHTGIVCEEDEACPISSYGIQKLTIEKLLYLYGEIKNLDYRIVRLSNPYGPFQKPNGVQGVVSTFVWKAMNNEKITVYGDGSIVRDYIYIDDAITGILKIASDDTDYKLYNLGSGEGLSVNQIIEAIGEVLDKELHVEYTAGRSVDVPKNVLDISRYKIEFGNPHFVDIKDGISYLADFYEEQL